MLARRISVVLKLYLPAQGVAEADLRSSSSWHRERWDRAPFLLLLPPVFFDIHIPFVVCRRSLSELCAEEVV
jgi:hypothetical protein